MHVVASPLPWLVGVCGLAGLAVVGCGRGNGLKRVAVQGKVEHQGGPLKAGSISFLPAQGLKAPAAVGDVIDGAYRFTAGDGPVAGTYRVVVMLPPEGHKKMPAAAGKHGPPDAGAATAKSLPGRWEFRVDVPDQGSFQYDVRLP